MSGLFVEKKLNCGFLLLKPSINVYDKIHIVIKKNFDKLSKKSKPFEYLVNLIYKPKKLDIEIGINKYENTDGIQYSIDKPFLMSSDKTIAKRVQLKHFKIWFIYLTNLINNYSNFKKYKCLNESLEISKYFLHDLNRYRINFADVKKKNLFDITKEYYDISDIKHVNYYYLDISKEYNSKFPLYTFNTANIHEIINYSIHTDSDKKLYVESKFENIFKFLNYVSKHNIIFLNQLLKNILKIHVNSFAILQIDKKKQTEELKEDLIYEFDIKMNGQSLQNLIFNVYQNYTFRQRLIILSTYDYNTEYTINIQIFVTKFQLNLLNYTNDTYFYLIVEPETRIKLSSIIFNSITLNKIKNNNLCWIINNNINKKTLCELLYFQTLKKWLYNNYTGEQIDKIAVKQENNKLILISTNETINFKSKIKFIEIISSDEIKMNLNLDDTENYWELEGIKFLK
jgi:hypothetical protein